MMIKWWLKLISNNGDGNGNDGGSVGECFSLFFHLFFHPSASVRSIIYISLCSCLPSPFLIVLRSTYFTLNIFYCSVKLTCRTRTQLSTFWLLQLKHVYFIIIIFFISCYCCLFLLCLFVLIYFVLHRPLFCRLFNFLNLDVQLKFLLQLNPK